MASVSFMLSHHLSFSPRLPLPPSSPLHRLHHSIPTSLSPPTLLLLSPLLSVPTPSWKFSSHFVNRVAQPDEIGEQLEASGDGAQARQRVPPTPQGEQELSQAVLVWRALKLPIYSVALVPLSVGAAAAYWQTRVFYAGRYCLLLFSAVLVITWLNLSNDAYDSETGVDKDKKESVVNMTGSRQGVHYAAYACLIGGIIGLVRGAWQSQNMQVVLLLAAAIASGYVYQCPPFRLSYKGLGEPLCFLAFGPLATTAFYLCQATRGEQYLLPVTGTIIGAAVLVGITTTLILFCSHFHQIEGDRLVGKISPLVRLGTQQGSEVVKAAVVGLYSFVLMLAALKLLPVPCAVFSIFTLPVGKLVLDFVRENHQVKEKIFLAKYYCVRLHAAFGAALVLGFVTAAQLPTLRLR